MLNGVQAQSFDVQLKEAYGFSQQRKALQLQKDYQELLKQSLNTDYNNTLSFDLKRNWNNPNVDYFSTGFSLDQNIQKGLKANLFWNQNWKSSFGGYLKGDYGASIIVDIFPNFLGRFDDLKIKQKNFGIKLNSFDLDEKASQFCFSLMSQYLRHFVFQETKVIREQQLDYSTSFHKWSRKQYRNKLLLEHEYLTAKENLLKSQKLNLDAKAQLLESKEAYRNYFKQEPKDPIDVFLRWYDQGKVKNKSTSFVVRKELLKSQKALTDIKVNTMKAYPSLHVLAGNQKIYSKIVQDQSQWFAGLSLKWNLVDKQLSSQKKQDQLIKASIEQEITVIQEQDQINYAQLKQKINRIQEVIAWQKDMNQLLKRKNNLAYKRLKNGQMSYLNYNIYKNSLITGQNNLLNQRAELLTSLLSYFKTYQSHTNFCQAEEVQ